MAEANDRVKETKKRALGRARETEEMVSEYREDSVDIARDLTWQVRDSYTTTLNLSLSLLGNNFRMIDGYNEYIGQVNRVTRVVILIGCILLFIACIYPPYNYITRRGTVFALQYVFLFSTPRKSLHFSYIIDWGRLALEIVAIVALTVGGVVLVKIFNHTEK